MIWYIIRHADKEPGDFYNPVLRHQDQPISSRGIAQARNLVAYFKEKEITSIYISEYVRTKQTIAFTADMLGLSLIVDNRLNEIDNGLIDGLTGEEIREKFPTVWNVFKKRDQDFQFPEGESGAQAQDRIKSFFIERQKDNTDIILVSHDGLIRLMACYILGLDVYQRWDFQVDTCGIMEIEYQPEYERWKLLCFNQTRN